MALILLKTKESVAAKAIPKDLLMSGDITRIDMGKVAEIGCHPEQKPVSLEALDRWIGEVPLPVKGRIKQF